MSFLPSSAAIRKRFSRVYYQFKPDCFMWVEAIILRKFCVAATYILFNKNAAFQLAAALLILFLAYAAQVKNNPYMSAANHEEVLRDHVQASYTSAIHARLRATIASIEYRGRKKAHRNVLRGDGKIDASAVLGLLTSFLFDYNTVESTMIFAAAIICLMGIMFSAQAKAAAYYASSRDAITAVVLTVAIVSIIYLVTVIVVEIYILYTEEQRRRALAKKAAAGKAKGEMDKSGRGRGGKRGGGGSDFVAGDVNNAMNPMFMTAGGAGAAANVATDTNAAAEAIRSMVNPPPTVELWQVYKDTFLQLRGRLEDLKTQLDTFPSEVKNFAAQENAKHGGPPLVASTSGKPAPPLSLTGGGGNSSDVPSKAGGGKPANPLSSKGGTGSSFIVAADQDPSTAGMGENELAALRMSSQARGPPPVGPPGSVGGAGAAGGSPMGRAGMNPMNSRADSLSAYGKRPAGR